MNKSIIILLLLSMPAICRADYELRLNDGVTLTWREYTIEEDRYCTQKEFGKFCIQKRDVSSVREARGSATDASPSNKTEELRKTDCNKIKTVGGALGGSHVVSVATPQKRGRKISTTDLRFIAPSARSGTIRWRYTFEAPPRDWMSPRFIDTGWKEGIAGFGADTPGAPIGTPWRSTNIWMRREFTLAKSPSDLPALWVQHDDDIEIYLNGFLAASKEGWSLYYDFVPISAEARQSLRRGRNLIAIHCRNQGGPQYADAGIVAFPYADLPTTGSEVSPRLEVFTDKVKKFMKENLIPAGTIAVMKKDRVVVSRGIGYSDPEQTLPLPADAIMRLASLDKLITNAAMKTLIRRSPRLPTPEMLTLNTRVFPLLQAYGIALPPGSAADPRMRDITIGQLLEHRSGLAHFPGHGSLDLERDLGLTGPADPKDKTRWIMTQPLRFAPGTQYEYNSSAYAVARYLIHLVSGDLETFLKDGVLKPARTKDVGIARSRPEDRDPREPWYSSRSLLRNVIRPGREELVPEPDGAINLEAALALTASAEGFARFLRCYHIGHGTPLEDPATGAWAAVPDNGLGVYFGSMAGTFTIAIQRRWDEVNIVVLFNQSGKYDTLADELNRLVDRIPPDAWEH
jgi:CubicO group peptidase (beta-lactamase class C family)